ncbi:MAG: hypothetical protein IPF42_01645 [Candidatus Microthrix sp.]|nr:hypothetical protein [Candidatus Microthrix sp.]
MSRLPHSHGWNTTANYPTPRLSFVLFWAVTTWPNRSVSRLPHSHGWNTTANDSTPSLSFVLFWAVTTWPNRSVSSLPHSHGWNTTANDPKQPPSSFVLLGRDDLAEPKRVETAALAWLEHHGERRDAQFVLGPLLGRDDLAEPKRVETAALAWLEHHGELPDAQFVLGPLLGRDDLAEPKRVETAALAWLEHHSATDAEAASFVLGPLWAVTTWLNRSVSRLLRSHGWNATSDRRRSSLFVLRHLLGRDDLAEPKRVETAALAWLEHHSERPDASFVLGPLLGRDDLAEPKRVETAALAWLEHHSATDAEAASFVFVIFWAVTTWPNRSVSRLPRSHGWNATARPTPKQPPSSFVIFWAVTTWPNRSVSRLPHSHGWNTTANDPTPSLSSVLFLGRDDLAEPKRVETAALAWLERHSERPDAQFVLGPLLGRDDLAEPKRVETAALAWLEHHSELPNAQFVLSPMVPRRTFTNREVLLRLFVQWCNANYSLKNVTFPNSRQWLKYWIDEVIRPRFEDDGGALTPAAADAFTVRMIPDNRTGIAAALIDDLLVDWLSWPGSMRSALPRSIQNPTIPSRVASLIRVERLQAASPAVVRFQTWIGAWDEPIRSNASALARVPGDL